MYNELASGLGKFISDNDDIERGQDNILIHLLERGGRLHVMIEVSEHATQDKLRKIIPLACVWRDRVMNYQRAWHGGGVNELLERLHEMNKAGISYLKIARMLNSKVEAHLQEYIDYRAEIDSKYPQFKKELDEDIYHWVFLMDITHSAATLDKARSLLMAVRLEDEEIDFLLRDGLERMKAGESPFDKDKPISRQRILEILRSWRKSREHKSIQAQEQPGV